MRLGRFQSQRGRCGEEKKLLFLPGIQLQFFGRPACSPLFYRPRIESVLPRNNLCCVNGKFIFCFVLMVLRMNLTQRMESYNHGTRVNFVTFSLISMIHIFLSQQFLFEVK
jgi:hypothetical protein